MRQGSLALNAKLRVIAAETRRRRRSTNSWRSLPVARLCRAAGPPGRCAQIDWTRILVANAVASARSPSSPPISPVCVSVFTYERIILIACAFALRVKKKLLKKLYCVPLRFIRVLCVFCVNPNPTCARFHFTNPHRGVRSVAISRIRALLFYSPVATKPINNTNTPNNRQQTNSEAIDSVEREKPETAAAAAGSANGRRSNATAWTKYIPTMGAIHQAINDIFVVTVVPECFIVLWLTGL